MRKDFLDVLENVGLKVVTKTDKDKGAYVLNESQRTVLEAAGINPGDGGENAVLFELDVPNDPDGLKLNVSYYNSVRRGAGRTPEARMGRDIVRWMEVGDEIALANVGRTVFVWKENAPTLPLGQVASSIADQADPNALLEKARRAKGLPRKQERSISDFQRSSAVVAGAIARAGGRCEMPNCNRDTFNRPDGTTYLEVHHVTPLAEGGEDTMLNAAALCPTCHRELHYGNLRLNRREILRRAIAHKEGER